MRTFRSIYPLISFSLMFIVITFALIFLNKKIFNDKRETRVLSDDVSLESMALEIYEE